MTEAELDARAHLILADHLTADGSYCDAFNNYMMAFHKAPGLKHDHEMAFRSLLSLLIDDLTRDGDMEKVFQNLSRALNIFPENKYLINDTGKYLYQSGFYMEAWSQFQKALQMDSGFVNAENNLNSIKNLLLERWHYRMLNDKIRNESYHEAIKEIIKPNMDSVIDVGCGTGLLSLYCLEHNPLSLAACDSSEQMVKITERILDDIGCTEAVIINEMSTEIDYKDIGGKKSLLVTELFDAGLFGEHILPSLDHAHEKLLSIDGRVLPNKAEFFIIGAKCDHLNHKYQLSSSIKTVLNIPSRNVHIFQETETYDCEDVCQFSGLKYMTEPKSLLKIDFNDHNDITEKLNRSEPYNVKLKALEDGEINVVIGYFNLYLTDNVTITTDPKSEKRANAWQQAVFYDFISQSVVKDATIDINFLLNEGKLELVQKPNTKILKISQDVVRFLNDKEYVGTITKSLGMALVYLGQMTEMSQITVLDLCPFPLFGLLMLQRGAKSVTCCCKTKNDKKFLQSILKANQIPLSKINIIFGEKWSSEILLDKKYPVIFCNVLDLSGDLCPEAYTLAQHLRNAHLLPGGLFMPTSVSLVGQVVNSEWLDINNRVYDKNTSDYKIGKYINKFQVSQNFGIDLSCLEYTALTEPVVLGKVGSMSPGVDNIPVIKTGDANAILCWYNIELLENLRQISTNRGDSFIDATVFLANPSYRIYEGKVVNILRCIDLDGIFKLMIDDEAT